MFFLFLHDFECTLNAIRVFGDETRDLLCCRLGLLGKLSYFLGNDREAASLLSCASRFDCGVESEEVRLSRNFRDHLNDLGDAFGTLIECCNGVADILCTLIEDIHALHGDAESLLAFDGG